MPLPWSYTTMSQVFGNLQINLTVKVAGRKIRIKQRLGNGVFGVIYKVKDEASSRVYALKHILCKPDKQIKNAIREVQTMKQICHENVISMTDAEQFRDQRYKLHMLILTEYFVIHRPSSEEENFKWIRQMAAALVFLHSRSVVPTRLENRQRTADCDGGCKIGRLWFVPRIHRTHPNRRIWRRWAVGDELWAVLHDIRHWPNTLGGTRGLWWPLHQEGRCVFSRYFVFRNLGAGFYYVYGEGDFRCFQECSWWRQSWHWACDAFRSKHNHSILISCTRIQPSAKDRSRCFAVQQKWSPKCCRDS